MKKLICAMGVLCLFLTACGEGSTAESAPPDYVSTSDAAQAVADYLGWEDLSPLEQEDRDFYLSERYGIEEGAWTEATIYAATGVDARELVVLRLSDAENAETVAAALEEYRQNRRGDFFGYFPDQAALVENGGVVTTGRWVALLICGDMTAARTAFETATGEAAELPAEPTPYDWENAVDEKGYWRFIPPNEFDMTPYDTTAILTAWETGDESGLSEKDAAILAKCREIFRAYVTEEMTGFQKEVVLHDWLVENCAYDQTVLDDRTPMGREDNRNPYGMLVDGYGICLGYATTFQLFMDLAGVECITVVGASAASSADHAWNMVKLEGEWYCVDPTWDDSTIPHPEAYIQGELSRRHHHYFNVTSQEMRENDHQWDYENIPEATATRFRWNGVGKMPE